MPSKPPEVFISYSQSDQGVVEDFIRALVARKVELWVDIDIRAGDNWMERIEAALDEASIFVLFLSPSFLRSQWAMIEIGVALSRVRESGAVLIPVLVRDAAIPEPIKSFRFIDARSVRPEDFADEISKLMEKLKQTPNPGAAPDG